MEYLLNQINEDLLNEVDVNLHYNIISWKFHNDFPSWIEEEVLFEGTFLRTTFYLTLTPGRQFGYLFTSISLRVSQELAATFFVRAYLNDHELLTTPLTAYIFDESNDFSWTHKIRASSGRLEAHRQLLISIVFYKQRRRWNRDHIE
ncbi:hypothetical protein CDAR_549341 [Caerostris darwini]|uniref:Uncharacterized protein n=1 Tax=Caerostris darwini TaxID=1538125 RepID=A0AAV4XA37_9ARAC|nr:hypothetical protein CDAR_549341 [Caerostris darwini]